MSPAEESPARDGGAPVVAAVGLATTQGGAAELRAGREPVAPVPLPWPAGRWTTSGLCRPALGIDPGLAGAERWRALARQALAECCAGGAPAAGTPLVVASCNGAAPGFEAAAWRGAFDTAALLDPTPWAGARLPVVSGACAAGLQALFLARLLLAAGAREAVVLAVDVLAPSAHANFEALRILSPGLQAPWQPGTEGFLCGEAAVALRLRRGGPGPRLRGPALSQDLAGEGGLGRALGALGDGIPVDLILGQGTGPPEVDRTELAAVQQAVPDLAVPLTTTLHHFGHTLGASGLLGLALAALRGSGPDVAALPALALPASRATDGRALLDGAGRIDPGRGRQPGHERLVVCRALGGACAAAGLTVPGGTAAPDSLHPDRAGGGKFQRHIQGPVPEPVPDWAAPVPPGPIHHPLLRRLAEEAPRHRPAEPPDLLVVHLAAPLEPPPRAVIGGRLLPSAVLEITPGRAALQVAEGWGYRGPALCLVGAGGLEPLLSAATRSGRRIGVIYVDPGFDHVRWS